LRNLFVPARSKCSAFQTHIHRLSAVVEWKAVARTLT
jgi:putative transposase